LIERKKHLAVLIPAQTGIVCSTLTIEAHGQELFDAVLRTDVEGIVAKRMTDPYDARTRWLKVKNPTYTQAEGRRELFERRPGNDFPSVHNSAGATLNSNN
jgi:ATP-dependent DNA ligase